MIVKEECLYQGTIKGSDIDTFLLLILWKEDSNQDARIMLQNIVKKCRKMLQKPIKNAEKCNETH